uniref:WAP domain-containing protein n=1 Tax=Suricata suricatta TaxID=37032 RepID=A0A673SNZ7_SURSU
MRCLASLALALLALEAALAVPPPTHLPVPCAGQATCPELSSSEEDSCIVSCTDDSCPQGTQCCPTSPCSRSCVVPIMAPLQKTGSCPQVQVPLSSEPCTETTDCSSDSQCEGSKKCCPSVCTLRCLDPIAEDPLQ